MKCRLLGSKMPHIALQNTPLYATKHIALHSGGAFLLPEGADAVTPFLQFCRNGGGFSCDTLYAFVPLMVSC